MEKPRGPYDYFSGNRCRTDLNDFRREEIPAKFTWPLAPCSVYIGYETKESQNFCALLQTYNLTLFNHFTTFHPCFI